MSSPAPSNESHAGAPDGHAESPSPSQSEWRSPSSDQQPSTEFNPFPFGAPNPDSPVAAAFPEIFPAAVPVPNPYAAPAAPPWEVPASAHTESAPSPWAPPAGPQPQQPLPDSARRPDEQQGAHFQTFHGHYPGQPPVHSAPRPYPSGPYPPGQPAPGQQAPAQYTPGQYAPGQYAPDQSAPGQYASAQHWPGSSPGYPSAGYATPHHAVNGKAIAGMVLGIVSIAFFFLTLLDVPLIVLGIVFSTLGLRAARRGEGRRAMALAGLICSIVAAAVVVVAFTYVAHRSSVCENRFDRGSANYNNCMIHFN